MEQFKAIMEKMAFSEYNTIVSEMMRGFFESSVLNFSSTGFLGALFILASMAEFGRIAHSYLKGNNIFNDLFYYIIWANIVFLCVGHLQVRSVIDLGKNLGQYDYDGRQTLIRDAHNFTRMLGDKVANEAFGDKARARALTQGQIKRKGAKDLVVWRDAICGDIMEKNKAIKCIQEKGCFEKTGVQFLDCYENTKKLYTKRQEKLYKCSYDPSCYLNNYERKIKNFFTRETIIALVFDIFNGLLFFVYMFVQIGISIIIIFSLFMCHLIVPLAVYEPTRSNIKESITYVVSLGLVPFVYKVFNYISFNLMNSVDQSLIVGFNLIMSDTGSNEIAKFSALQYQGIKSILYGIISIGIQLVVLSKLPQWAYKIFKLELQEIAKAGDAFLDGAKTIISMGAAAATGGIAMALGAKGGIAGGMQALKDKFQKSPKGGIGDSGSKFSNMGGAPSDGAGGSKGFNSSPRPSSGGSGSLSAQRPIDVNIQEDYSQMNNDPDVAKGFSSLSASDLKESSPSDMQSTGDSLPKGSSGGGLSQAKSLGGASSLNSSTELSQSSSDNISSQSTAPSRPSAPGPINESRTDGGASDPNSYTAPDDRSAVGAAIAGAMSSLGAFGKSSISKGLGVANDFKKSKFAKGAKNFGKGLGKGAISGAGAIIKGTGKVASVGASLAKNSAGLANAMLDGDPNAVINELGKGAKKSAEGVGASIQKFADNNDTGQRLTEQFSKMEDVAPTILSEAELQQKAQDLESRKKQVEEDMALAKEMGNFDRFVELRAENENISKEVRKLDGQYDSSSLLKTESMELLSLSKQNKLTNVHEDRFRDLLLNPEVSSEFTKMITRDESFKGSKLEKVLQKVRKEEKAFHQRIVKELEIKLQKGVLDDTDRQTISKLSKSPYVDKTLLTRLVDSQNYKGSVLDNNEGLTQEELNKILSKIDPSSLK